MAQQRLRTGKRRRGPVEHWGLAGALNGWVERDAFRFHVAVNDLYGQLHVIGIVTPAVAVESEATNERIAQVMSQHAHQYLGSFQQLDDAQDAARLFLRTAPVPTQLCPCKDVER